MARYIRFFNSRSPASIELHEPSPGILQSSRPPHFTVKEWNDD
jgi:hypothetical protein